MKISLSAAELQILNEIISIHKLKNREQAIKYLIKSYKYKLIEQHHLNKSKSDKLQEIFNDDDNLSDTKSMDKLIENIFTADGVASDIMDEDENKVFNGFENFIEGNKSEHKSGIISTEQFKASLDEAKTENLLKR
jgi:hypothetical protein